MTSATHLVLLPTYNTGPRLRDVIAEVLEHWQPVLVVVDGSTDGSEQPIIEMARSYGAESSVVAMPAAADGEQIPGAGEGACAPWAAPLSVIVLPRNSGKGAAVLAGARWARERGFTHALAMDADGQHPAASIAEFMDISRRQPDTLVLGRPIFPSNIPRERLHGRKISVALVWCAILGRGIGDPLFGFRIYPLGPLLAALGARRTGRRYDFDAEAAVRLCWAGVRPLNVPAPVRYFSRDEGGISHYHYVRDNIVMGWMHLRLIVEMLFRHLPAILRLRRQRKAGPTTAVAGGLSAETVR